MARTPATKTSTSATTTSQPEMVSIPKATFDEMNERMAKFEAIANKLLEEKESSATKEVPTTVKSPDPFVGMNKMNIPCTLIHMLECNPNLPTTIVVNGVTHYFTSFGEKKSFTWGDMSNIVSKYRVWFNRGVFALAEDCEMFKNELPSDIFAITLPDYFYNQMTSISKEDFERNLNSLTSSQKVQVANTWLRRYHNNRGEYKDIEKIKILNRETNGLLKDIVSELIEKE